MAARSDVADARAQRLAAEAAFLPQLSIEDQPQLYKPIGKTGTTVIGGTVVPGGEGFYYNTVAATFNLNLINGGKDEATLRSALDLLQSAQANLNSALNQVFEKVLSDYESVAKDQEQVAQEKQVISMELDMQALALMRYQHLTSSRLTVIQAEQQTLQDKTDLNKYLQQEVTDSETLLRDMGYKNAPGVIFRVQQRLPSPPASNSPAKPDPTGDPAVQAAYSQFRYARQQVAVARSGYWPTLSLVTQYNALGIDLNSAEGAVAATKGSSYSVGLSLKVPLSPFFTTVANVQSAEAGVQKALGSYDGALTSVVTRQLAARARYRNAVDGVTLAKRAATLAETSLDLTRKRYEAQLGNRIDVDTAQVAVKQARTGFDAAQNDAVLAGWLLFRAYHPQEFTKALLRSAAHLGNAKATSETTKRDLLQ